MRKLLGSKMHSALRVIIQTICVYSFIGIWHVQLCGIHSFCVLISLTPATCLAYLEGVTSLFFSPYGCLCSCLTAHTGLSLHPWACSQNCSVKRSVHVGTATHPKDKCGTLLLLSSLGSRFVLTLHEDTVWVLFCFGLAWFFFQNCTNVFVQERSLFPVP